MQLPPHSWKNTLTRLGLKRGAGKRNQAKVRRRPSQIESLELRQLLASDVIVTGFRSDGDDWIVDYSIAGEDAAPFDVAVYRSSDGATLGTQLGTVRVADSGQLAVGAGYSQSLAPDFTDTTDDYYLIAVVDAGQEISETDETNNQQLFAGGVFRTADDVVHVHGSDLADAIEIDEPLDLEVTLNAVTYSYDTADVSAAHVRAHAGADTLTVDAAVAETVNIYGAAPIATLADPAPGTTLYTSDLNSRGYLDIAFSGQLGSDLDAGSITDEAPEIVLGGAAAADVTLGGAGELVGGDTYRYAFTGNFTVGEVEVQLPAGSFANTLGIANTSAIQNFTLQEPASEFILDNSSSTGVTIAGDWLVQTNSIVYGLTELNDQNTGKGMKSVTFAPTIDAAGEFDVYIRYSSHSNRATMVPIDIAYAGGVSTRYVNQQHDGGEFVYLGAFSFAAGDEGYIRIRTDGTNGYVIADAVRLVRKTADVASPTRLTAPLGRATVLRSELNDQGYLEVTFADPAGVGLNPASLVDAAPEFSLSGPGVANVTLSGAAEPVGDDTYRYHFTGGFGSGAVQLNFIAGSWSDALGTPNAASSSGFHVVLPTPDEVIVDNASSQATFTGAWTLMSSTSTYAGTSRHDGDTGKGTKTATFIATVGAAGRYQVSSFWLGQSNRPSNVPHALTHSGGTTNLSVNQKTNTGAFNLLGTFEFAAGATATATITTAGTSGYVMADAFRWKRIVNSAPEVVQSLIPTSLAEDDATFSVDLRNHFTDFDMVHDGDMLRFAVVNAEPGLVDAAIDGHFLRITPIANQSGVVTLTVRALDLEGLWVELPLEVTITPVNDPPTATADEFDAIVKNSSDNVLDVLANDSGVPDTGETLSLVSVGVPSHGGAAAIVGGVLHYTPAEDFVGVETFSYTISDGTPGSEAVAWVSVTVTALNQPPVLTTPTAQSTPEDTPLTFSSANNNAIVLTDVDAGSGPLEITLTASNGLFALGSTTDLGFIAGDGAGAAQATFRGTLAALQSALDGLVFTPAENFTGAASLAFAVSDLGNSGIGGPLTAFGTLEIDVQAVNDAPQLSLPQSQGTTKNRPLVFSAARRNRLQIADVDAASLTLSLTAANGVVTLSETAGLTFAQGDGSDDAELVFSGAPAAIQAALDGLVFTPTTDFLGAASLALVVEDLGSSGAGAAFTASGGVAIDVPEITSSTVLPEADVYVDQFYSSTNYGSLPTIETLQYTYKHDSFLRFDLSHLTGPVTDARVRLHPILVPSPTSVQYVAEVASDSWQEGTTTYNNRPASGASFASFIPQLGVPVEINVTALVNAALASNDTALSLRLYTNNGNQVKYGSRENTTGAAPELIVAGETSNSAAVAQDDGVYLTGSDLTNPAGPVLLSVAAENGLLSNDFDDEHNPLTVELVDNVGQGTLVLQPNGAFTYLPNEDFIGLDSFTYRVWDGAFWSNVAEVTIDVYEITQATVLPVADAYVLSNQPNSNFGGSIYLRTLYGTYTNESFLRYDLSNITGPITSALVRLVPLTVGSPAPANRAALVADDSWSETGITWNNKPGSSATLATWTPVAGQPVLIDVTDAVNAAVAAGDTQLSLRIYSASHSNVLTQYGSRELMIAGRPTAILTGALVNTAPHAEPESNYQIGRGATLVVPAAQGVLLNDTDAEDNLLTAELAVDPQHGVVALNADGSFEYTPEPGFFGVDSFRYRAYDGGLLSNQATVTIEVYPVTTAAWPAVADATVTSAASPGAADTLTVHYASQTYDAFLRFDLSQVLGPITGAKVQLSPINVTGAPSNYVAHVSNDSWDESTISWSNRPSSGSAFATVTPQMGAQVEIDVTSLVNAAVAAGDTLLSLRLWATVQSTTNFTYYASSENTIEELRPRLVITGELSNAAPHVAYPVATQAIDEDAAPVAIDLAQVFGDADLAETDDALTLSLVGNSQPGMVSAALNGTLLTLTPLADQNGVAQITVRATDSQNAWVESTIQLTIRPINDPPRHTLPAAAFTQQETPLVFSQAGGNAFLVSDVDAADGTLEMTLTAAGGVLTLGATDGLTFPLGHTGENEASLTLAGSLAAINAALDGLIFTPAAGYYGDATLTLHTSDQGNSGDGGPLLATDTLDIRVNARPTTSGHAPLVVDEDAPSEVLDLYTLFDDVEDADASLVYSAIDASQLGLVQLSVAAGQLTVAFPPHAYGVSYVALRATDTDGAWVETTLEVTIQPVNDPPTAVNDAETVAEDSAATTLDVLANDSDLPDAGETLTITALGTPSHGGAVQIVGNQIRYSPAPNYFGTETFTYTINDGTPGSNATATVAMTVLSVNDPPTAVDDAWTVQAGSTTGLAVLDNDSTAPDPGETLTITEIGPTSHGGAASIVNDQIQYIPALGFSGVETFTYTISDGNGGSATATVTIEVLNAPPTANDDVFSAIDEDDVDVVLDVLANDSTAPDSGESLSIISVGPSIYGSILTIASDGQSLLYTPAPNFSGVETFSYTINDGTPGNLATAIITLNVQPLADPPEVVESILDIFVLEDASNVTIDLSQFIQDPDVLYGGETLTYSATSANPGLATTSIVGTQLTLAFAPGESGSTSITIQAIDSLGAAVEIVVPVYVAPSGNMPPTAQPIPDVNKDEGDLIPPIILSDYFTDPDEGDFLTFEVFANSNSDLVKATIAGDILQLTASPNQHGSGQVTIRAKDRSGRSAEADVQINLAPVNDPPEVAQEMGSIFIPENAGEVHVNFQDVFSDIDLPAGEELTLSITGQPNGDLVTAEFQGHTLIVTPVPNKNGTTTIQVAATDDADAASANLRFEIVVVAKNSWPELSVPLSPLDVNEDEAPYVLFSDKKNGMKLGDFFGDADHGDDDLSYEIALIEASPQNPVSAAVLEGDDDVKFTLIPDAYGYARYSIRAVDPLGASIATDLWVVVNPTDDPPTVDNADPITLALADNQIHVVDLWSVFHDKEDGKHLTFDFVGDYSSEYFASDYPKFDWESGLLLLKAAPGAEGTKQLKVVGKDRENQLTGEKTITVDVDAPVDVVVSIVQGMSTAEEGDEGFVKLVRSGGDLSESLDVYYELGDPSLFETRFNGPEADPNDNERFRVSFEAGSAFATIPIQAIDNSAFDGDATATISILDDDAYIVAAASEAASRTITIYDNEYSSYGAEVLVIGTLDAVEGGPTGLVRLLRRGETSDLLDVKYQLSGSADFNDDYTGPSGSGGGYSLSFPSTKSTADVLIEPVDDEVLEGEEDIDFELLNDDGYGGYGGYGGAYTIGAPGGGQVMIDDNPWDLDLLLDDWQAEMLGDPEEQSPGAFLRRNDDFDEGNQAVDSLQLPNGSNAKWTVSAPDDSPVRDYLAFHQINESDDELLHGALLVGSGSNATLGTLEWTIPNHVKVWWRPYGIDRWLQVQSGDEYSHLANGTSIPILIEGINAASGDIKVKFTAQGRESKDTAKVTVQFADLDIDSDNTGAGPTTPDRNDIEEWIEADGAKPGKFVELNQADRDGDGILDFTDGFNLDDVAGTDDDEINGPGADFTPLVFQISPDIDLNAATVTFSYNAANPDDLIVNSEGVSLPSGSGALRIWTKNGSEARKQNDIDGKNFFVVPGTPYSASSFDFGEARTVTLYVEGVASTPTAEGISVVVGQSGGSSGSLVLSDAVQVTVTGLDADVDSDNTGGLLGGPERSGQEENLEAHAERPGKFVDVNDADRDNDGIVDYADGFNLDQTANNADDDVAAGGAGFTPLVVEIPFHVDLSLATLKILYSAGDPTQVIKQGATQAANFELSSGAGNLRVWTRNGGAAREAEKIGAKNFFVQPEMVYRASDFNFVAGENGYTTTLYVEGLNPSATLGGDLIEVELDSDGLGAAAPKTIDKVRLSVVNVDLDIDSDNDEALAANFQRSGLEDVIEDHPNHGKIVSVNYGDRDGDGIPDWLDGFNGNGIADDADDKIDVAGPLFVPLILEIPAPIDISKARLRFEYSAADPADGEEAEGHLRIWTKNGAAKRDQRSVGLGGDFIKPETNYLFSALAGTDRTVTLYVEGIAATTGDLGRIVVKVDPDGDPIGDNYTEENVGFEITDAVRVIVPSLDLDADSDNNQGLALPGRTPAEELIENRPFQPATPGKFVVVNKRDVDADGVVDFADGFDRNGVAGDEDDQVDGARGQLTPLVLQVPEGVDLSKARFRFQYNGSDPSQVRLDNHGAPQPAPGYLRVWTNSEGRDPEAANADNPGDYIAPYDPNETSNSLSGVYSWTELGGVAGVRTLTLYVEGIAISPATAPSPGNGGGFLLGQQQILVEMAPDSPESTTPNYPAYPDDTDSTDDTLSEYQYGLTHRYSELKFTTLDSLLITVVDEVSITAVDAYAAESPTEEKEKDEGAFLISRGEGNISGDLRVFFQLEASALALGPDVAAATLYSDYLFKSPAAVTFDSMTLKGSVVIPHGASSVPIYVIPRNQDGPEWDEVVQLKLLAHPEYAGSAPYTDPVPTSPFYFIETDNFGAPLSTTRVTILDDDGIDGLLNRNVDTESTGQSAGVISTSSVDVSLQQGHAVLALPLAPSGFIPTYRGDDNVHPIVSVDLELPDGVVPSSIEATLTFGGITGDKVTFNTSSVSAGDAMRLVILGSEEIVQKLPSGHYDYDIEIVSITSSGKRTRTVRGGTEIANRSDTEVGTTELGKRWWIDGLDRLLPSDSISPVSSADAESESFAETLTATSRLAVQGAMAESGAALIRGDGTSAWYQATITAAGVVQTKDDQSISSGELYGWAAGSGGGGYLGGYRVSNAGLGLGDASASWNFEGLDSKRQYQIFTTWTPDDTRASNAPYTVSGGREVGSGASDKTILVDQRFTPGETELGGSRWRSLGFFIPGEEGEITVSLSSYLGAGLFVDGEIVADAVMLVGNWDYKTPDGSFNSLQVNVDPEPYAGENQSNFQIEAKYGNRYDFDAHGLLQRQVDRNGNRLEFDYTDADNDDIADELSTITTQGNLTTTYNYSGGHLSGVTDFAGRTTVFTGGAFITSVTGPDPGYGGEQPITTFLYEGPDGLLTKVTNARDNVTTLHYDPLSFRIDQVTQGDGQSWSLKAQLVDGLKTSAAGAKILKAVTGDLGEGEARATYTDPRNYVWTYQTDAYGLEIAKQNPAPFEDVWRYERNEHGQVKKKFEPSGGGGIANLGELTTSYDYDAQGNLTKVIYPQEKALGGLIEESWAYEGENSQLRSYTNGRGFTTIYNLDARGNVETITRPDGVTEVFEYTPTPTTLGGLSGGLLTLSTDPRGVVSERHYYGSGSIHIGLLQEIEHAQSSPGIFEAASTETFTYDSNRNLASHTQEMDSDADRVTTYEYDDLNRLVKVILPSAEHVAANGQITTGTAVTQYAYDALGLRIKTTDPLGRITEQTYDGELRPKITTLPEAEHFNGVDTGKIVLAYDANGNLLSQTDPLERTITYAYDARNLRTSETRPATEDHGVSITRYTYDALGNVKSVKDALHEDGSVDRERKYTYDALNRLTREDLPAPGAHPADGSSHGAPYVKYVYDDAGNLVSTIDALERETTYVYDTLNRRTDQYLPDPESGESTTHTEWIFDAAGNIERVIDSEENETEYAYDALNRKIQMTQMATSQHASPITEYEYNDAGELVLMRDPLERETVYQYDSMGRQILIREPKPESSSEHRETEFKYDLAGNLRLRIDGEKNTWETTYDELNRKVEEIAPAVEHLDPATGNLTTFKATTTYRYDIANQLREVEDALGRVTSYGYDQQGRQTTVTLPADQHGVRPQTVQHFDKVGNVVAVDRKVSAQFTQTTEYRYDHLDRLVRITEEEPTPGVEGFESYIYYDIAGREFATVDAEGRRTEYEYDNLDYRTEIKHPLLVGQSTPTVTRYEYDTLGNVVAEIDRRGNRTDFILDELYRVIEVKAPLTQHFEGESRATTTYVYDKAGRKRQEIGPLASQVTDYHYDDLDRLTKIELPETDHVNDSGVLEASRATQVFTYDFVDNRLTETDAEGNTTTFVFDDAYRLTKRIAPPTAAGASEFVFKYDAANQLRSERDQLNRTTVHDYDLPGRVIETVAPDPDGQGALPAPITRFEYDLLGNLRKQIRVMAGADLVTEYRYDQLLRLEQEIDGNGDSTFFTYDRVGNQSTQLDPEGNLTEYDYDAWNRLELETITVGGVEQTREFEYDLADNLVYLKDRDDREFVYGYDASNRRRAEGWFIDGLQVNEIFTSYDVANRVRSVSDESSTYVYGYDLQNRLTSISNAGTAGSPTVVLEIGYDRNNQRRTVAATVEGVADFRNEYVYNDRQYLTQLTQQGQSSGNAVAYKRVELDYDSVDQFQTQRRYASAGTSQLVVDTSFTYDLSGRLETLAHRAENLDLLAGYQWAYDQSNRVSHFHSSNDGTADYAYDDRDQLTSAQYYGYQSDESYDYDDNGNRTSDGFTTPAGSHNRLASDGEFTYLYDDQGNRTLRTRVSSDPADDFSTEYKWDVRNRLTKVTFRDNAGDATSSVEYAYDLHNRRIAKRHDADGDGQVELIERFVWDGEQIIYRFVDQDGDGAAAEPELANRYLWGQAVDQIFADEQVDVLPTPGEVVWPLTDNLGTVRDLATYDAALEETTVVTHRVFDAFGNLVSETDPSNPTGPVTEHAFAFTSQEFDRETGLYYYNARYYDPRTSTFLSSDPVEADYQNTYRYVGNSPTNATDPSGLEERRYTACTRCHAEHNFGMGSSGRRIIDDLGYVLPDYHDEAAFVDKVGYTSLAVVSVAYGGMLYSAYGTAAYVYTTNYAAALHVNEVAIAVGVSLPAYDIEFRANESGSYWHAVNSVFSDAQREFTNNPFAFELQRAADLADFLKSANRVEKSTPTSSVPLSFLTGGKSTANNGQAKVVLNADLLASISPPSHTLRRVEDATGTITSLPPRASHAIDVLPEADKALYYSIDVDAFVSVPRTTVPRVLSDTRIRWTATRPRGTGYSYDVIQRTDINWQRVRVGGDQRAIGMTNAEAARRFGLGPELDDGFSATLHHVGQDAIGPLVEASRRYHGVGRPGHDSIHSIYGKNQPHPTRPVDHQLFDVDSREYWRWRAPSE